MASTKRAVAAIAGGTAGGQLIALACSPVISRLVPPDEYGPFAVVNAAVMPLASVAALRLEAAVPLPQDDDEALDLVRVGMIVVGCFSVAAVGLGWVLREYLASMVRLESDARLIVWAPVIAGLMGTFVLLNQLAIRARMYSAIARRNVLQAGTTAISQVVFGFLGWAAHGLALGLALGQAVGVLSLIHALAPVWSARRNPPRRPGAVLRRYRRFPLLMMPSALANSLGLQAPVLLLAALYGPTVSGWMGMTQRILALPVALIGIAISQVFLGEFSAAKRSGSGDLMPLFLKTSRHLVGFGALFGCGVAALGPLAFSLVLGSQWHTSGVYAQYLATGLALQMVASPLSQTLIVMGRLGWQLTWDVLRLVISCLAVIVPSGIGASAAAAVGGLGVAMALSYAISWLMSWAVVRSSARAGI